MQHLDEGRIRERDRKEKDKKQQADAPAHGRPVHFPVAEVVIRCSRVQALPADTVVHEDSSRGGGGGG